ncbi:MAG: hypothetical protein GY811_26040 [Myxococcales bacterium]|nr:hypothetical protein [Myxococcales bacterium]
METENNYGGLIELLAEPSVVLTQWGLAFGESPMRLSYKMDTEVLSATLEPIINALADVFAPARNGEQPTSMHFCPGARELRELEKSVSFAAANLAVDGFTGFDVGALLLSLRDVLCSALKGAALAEMRHYMEWLVVLAADSLATGREQAAVERWHNQLDEGTPLIMITPELPATLFVCEPDRRVVASVFGRLLLTIVRTGAVAAIVDVRGVSGRMSRGFAEGLESFVGHARIAKRIRIFACGVHADDVPGWRAIAQRFEAEVHFENYFDSCVSAALEDGGWRLVSPA